MKRTENLIYLKDDLKYKRKKLQEIGDKMDYYTREYDKLLWDIDVLEHKIKIEEGTVEK